MPASLFIFLSDNQTHVEMLEKNLFGMIANWRSTVKPGDFCLLYNRTEGRLYGLWRAVSPIATYDSKAWGGKYPNQLRVERVSSEINSVRKTEFQHLNVLMPSGYPKPSIYGEIAAHLLELFSLKETVVPDVPSETLPTVEDDFRKRFPANYHCTDGHYVRSRAEAIIDNCLYKHRVCHGYETLVPIQEIIYPDFTVHAPDGKTIFIEYWGLENDPRYVARQQQKLNIYQKHNFAVIQIKDKDLENIDHVLLRELRSHRVI